MDDPAGRRTCRLFWFRGKVVEELADVFYKLFDTDFPTDGLVPAQYQRIVQNTLDLRDELDFGFAFNRSQATYGELLGAKAYIRGKNRFLADRERNKDPQG